jgi:pimeloyl-ACP methyl ester carboxylesterase
VNGRSLLVQPRSCERLLGRSEISTPPSARPVGLMNPLADEVLRLADGRQLAWAEWGDPRGAPVVFLHPSPGSRMLCPDPQATALAGVRLITVDRPGYGGSDPVADPTLTAFAGDLARLVDHLWLGQFPIVGWSGGGQYAAACAAVLGERVSALGLVAVPAPDLELPWLSPAASEAGRLAAVHPRRVLAAVAEVEAFLVTAPERAGDRWDNPSDVETRRQPGVEQALRVMWREGLSRGTGGLAADVVAGLRPWSFSPSRMQTPAWLFYGEDDVLVDLKHARWWDRVLPNSELTLIKAGHLVPFVSWADILGAVRP